MATLKLEEMTLMELKTELGRRGLDKTGDRNVLLTKLRKAVAAESATSAKQSNGSQTMKRTVSATAAQGASQPISRVENKSEHSAAQNEDDDCIMYVNEEGDVDGGEDGCVIVNEDIDGVPVTTSEEKKEEGESLPKADPDCTLWFSNLTPSCRAADIKTLCSKFGQVTSAKVKKSTKAAECKTFAVVTMSSRDKAALCVKRLHNSKFRGITLHVQLDSTRKAEKDAQALAEHGCLWVTNLPDGTKAAELKAIFSQQGKVASVKVKASKQGKCFGLVGMSSIEEADQCILQFNQAEYNGHILTVEKESKRKEEVKAQALAASNCLLIKELPTTIKATHLKTIFSQHGTVTSVKVKASKQGKCIGLVAMSSMEEANQCMLQLNQSEYNGHTLTIEKTQADVFTKAKSSPVKKVETANRRFPTAGSTGGFLGRRGVMRGRPPFSAPFRGASSFRGSSFRGGPFGGGSARGGPFGGSSIRGSSFRGSSFRGGSFGEGSTRGGPFRGGSTRGSPFRGGPSRGMFRGSSSGMQWNEGRRQGDYMEQENEMREQERQRTFQAEEQSERQRIVEALRLEQEREKLLMEKRKLDAQRMEAERMCKELEVRQRAIEHERMEVEHLASKRTGINTRPIEVIERRDNKRGMAEEWKTLGPNKRQMFDDGRTQSSSDNYQFTGQGNRASGGQGQTTWTTTSSYQGRGCAQRGGGAFGRGGKLVSRGVSGLSDAAAEFNARSEWKPLTSDIGMSFNNSSVGVSRSNDEQWHSLDYSDNYGTGSSSVSRSFQGMTSSKPSQSYSHDAMGGGDYRFDMSRKSQGSGGTFGGETYRQDSSFSYYSDAPSSQNVYGGQGGYKTMQGGDNKFSGGSDSYDMYQTSAAISAATYKWF